MKVILSRKGMDSASGGIPSPILPDGTLLSLPIPDDHGELSYKAISYAGNNYQQIIRQLKPNFNFQKHPFCHLDPDIYREIKGRPDGWIPAFGQHDISAVHLDNMGVGEGDWFLFYGMFQQADYDHNGDLKFVRGEPIRHIIYGYMEIKRVLDDPVEIQQDYSWHPHAVGTKKNNRLYLAGDYGTFRYDDRLVLTMAGQPKRSRWELPNFFADANISMSWQGENRPNLNGNSSWLEASSRGQEFVLTATTPEMQRKLTDWRESIIRTETDPRLEKKMVTHFVIPDSEGRYYCRMENAVIPVNYDKCRNCPLAVGSIQGAGVECYYEDAVTPKHDLHTPTHYDELRRISNLIKKGIVEKTPVRR